MMAGVVTASYIERHAGERLRRADVRDSFSMSVLVAAAEAELHTEVSYAAMNEWLTTYRMSAKERYVRVCLAPPERGGVGQRRHGLGCQGVGLVPMVSEQERVWKVSQFSVLVSC